MAVIEVVIDESKKLQIVKVKGDLSASEIIELAASAFHDAQYPYVIWDISEGSVSKITTPEVINVADQIKVHRNQPEGGKTALVANKSADFGIMRMYAVHAEIKNPDIKYEIFYNVDEALKWLEMEN